VFQIRIHIFLAVDADPTTMKLTDLQRKVCFLEHVIQKNKNVVKIDCDDKAWSQSGSGPILIWLPVGTNSIYPQ
jgi:hypothetical protein